MELTYLKHKNHIKLELKNSLPSISLFRDLPALLTTETSFQQSTKSELVDRIHLINAEHQVRTREDQVSEVLD